MAQVKCKICGRMFDRTKEEFVKVSSTRYAHAACALRDGKYTLADIIDPLDEVKCCYCGLSMSKSKDSCEQVSEGRWAHILCAEKEATREKTDKEKLELYIQQLFKVDYVPPQIQKQIQNYTTKYNYSYNGILMSLKYFYEIKHGSLEKANGRITIVEYVYEQARQYWYDIWLAQQANTPKIAILDEEYIPKVVEVKIDRPQSKPIRPNFFKFLDEEEKDD